MEKNKKIILAFIAGAVVLYIMYIPKEYSLKEYFEKERKKEANKPG